MVEGQKYTPLVQLIEKSDPEVERVSSTIRRAARKNVPIQEYEEGFYQMIDRCSMSTSELNSVKTALKSGAESLTARGKPNLAEQYTLLAEYVHNESAARH